MNQTSCSCPRIVDYAPSILVKIMLLSQFFLHMRTLKALMYLNVTDRSGSNLSVSMNQYH